MIRIKMRYIGYIISVLSILLNIFIDEWLDAYNSDWLFDIVLIVMSVVIIYGAIRNLTLKPLEACDFQFETSRVYIVLFFVTGILFLIGVMVSLSITLLIAWKLTLMPFMIMLLYYSIHKKPKGIYGEKVITAHMTFDLSEIDDYEVINDGYRIDVSKPLFIFNRIHSVNVSMSSDKRQAFESLMKRRHILKYSDH